MAMKETLARVKRIGLVVILSGAMLYGLGGCSFKSIGAGLLSEFLTSGGATAGTDALTSGLSSALGSFIGT